MYRMPYFAQIFDSFQVFSRLRDETTFTLYAFCDEACYVFAINSVSKCEFGFINQVLDVVIFAHTMIITIWIVVGQSVNLRRLRAKTILLRCAFMSQGTSQQSAAMESIGQSDYAMTASSLLLRFLLHSLLLQNQSLENTTRISCPPGVTVFNFWASSRSGAYWQ